MDEMIDPDVVTIFTDGSCYPNPNGPGGWGYVGMYREFTKEAYGHLPSTTTNVAELTAVLHAIKGVKDRTLPIHIVTDSKYVYRVFFLWAELWKRNGWTNSVGGDVANRELIERILKEKEGRNVTFAWTRGHQKGSNPYAVFNGRADELAGKGRKND